MARGAWDKGNNLKNQILMNNTELFNDLVVRFPYSPIYTSDKTYSVMEESSFLATSKYMKWILRIFGIFGWRDKFDCDDFALLWKMLTSLRHAKAKDGASQGVACGIVWYKDSITGSDHAINYVKTENGWKAFEPQTEEFFDLSEEERASAWFVLF